MTHYHSFIEANRIIDGDTHFYRVAVGSGKQADRDYLYLQAYAAQHQCYFNPYSRDVDDFLTQIARSLGGSSVLDLHIRAITARELVRHLKAGTAPALSNAQLANTAHQLRYLNLNYRCHSAASLRKSINQAE